MPLQINTPGDFAVELCRGVGAPVTQSNLQFIIAWSRAEGGHWQNAAHYNPLNTTQPHPGATAMNSVGVKAYTSWDQGVGATVAALRNGRYNDIVAALRGGDAARTAATAASLRTWSGGGYGTIMSLIPGSEGAAHQALATVGVHVPDPAPSQVHVRPVGTVLDPAELTDLARILEQRAEAVAALQDQLTGHLASAAWAGPASDAFRGEAQQSAVIMVHDTDALRLAASHLRRLADQLDLELAHLRGVEDKVRAWLALNPPVATALPPPWPAGDLPPTGDPRWREVERAFSAVGAI